MPVFFIVSFSLSPDRLLLFILMYVRLDVGIKSPFQRRKPKNTISLKKQVKFTDDVNVTDIMPQLEPENEELKVVANDEPSQGWLSRSLIRKSWLIANGDLTQF